MERFTAAVALDGKTATGIPVPDEVVAALGGGRPRVRVTVAGHTYRTTIARMHGTYKFPVSAAVRDAAGVTAGDVVQVSVELDNEPRTVEVPADLAEALRANPAVAARFDALSHSNRKRHVVAVEGAKTDATRQRRIAAVVASLTSAGTTGR